MQIIDAILLGIIEGVTEFLPISSTGHLILTSHLLSIAETPFLKSFEIIIQIGAIFAVVFLYRKILFTQFETLKKIFVAFIPTGIAGLFLYPFIKTLLDKESLVVSMLFIGGIILILFELWYKKKNKNEEKISDLGALSYRTAFLIGCAQTFAFIPGVSRAGATIIGGLLAGLARPTIVEFSFLLAVPTMVVAVAYDLLSNYKSFADGDFSLLLVGSLVSFITALYAIQFLLSFVKTHSFIPFGIYRIAVSIFFFFLFFF